MTEKKVLIITYYWPPSGGSGVQRWLKFVKYLPSFGYKPYIFTPENPAFAVQDESLYKDIPEEAEVIRFPIWEPYEMFFKLTKIFGGKKKTAKPTDLLGEKSFLNNISIWIRGNFFIPDPRLFWVRPAAKFLENFIHKNNIGTVITTGPPHSIHLIGLRLKKRNPSLRWLADFRDPWSEWGLLDSLLVTKYVRKIHSKLESKVLTQADEVITITPFYVRKFEALSNRNVQLLTNGFDENDFKDMVYKKSNTFLIRHIGIVNEKCDPRPFMEAVIKLMHAIPDFKSNLNIEFIGEVHPRFKAYVQASPELIATVTFKGNINHSQLMESYGESSLLILILTGYKDAAGYMPGKLFEYLATGLPILAVGPVDGDASALLKETHAGEMLDCNNIDGIMKVLYSNFQAWKNSDRPLVTMQRAEQYSRRMVTQSLTKLI